MSYDDHVIASFKRRKMQTWNRVKYWLVLLVIGFGLAGLIGSLDDRSPRYYWPIFAFAFGMAGTAIFAITRVVEKFYRCPHCNKVPVSGQFVEINPSDCPNCGRKLG